MELNLISLISIIIKILAKKKILNLIIKIHYFLLFVVKIIKIYDSIVYNYKIISDSCNYGQYFLI